MKLLTVPAARGFAWVRAGFRVFAMQPLACCAMFGVFMFSLIVLASFPYIGMLVAFALLPAATVGFVLGTEEILAGRVPTPTLLIKALRGPRERTITLVQMGLVYGVAGFALQVLADWLNPAFNDQFGDLMNSTGVGGGTAGDAMSAADATGLESGMLLRMVLPVPLALLFWHAPVIVYREGGGLVRALFASAVACWRNLGAFVVYGLSWGALISAASLLIVVVFTLLGQPRLSVIAVVPLVLAFSAGFYASLHFTIADCISFDRGDEPAAPTTPAPPSDA